MEWRSPAGSVFAVATNGGRVVVTGSDVTGYRNAAVAHDGGEICFSNSSFSSFDSAIALRVLDGVNLDCHQKIRLVEIFAGMASNTPEVEAEAKCSLQHFVSTCVNENHGITL